MADVGVDAGQLSPSQQESLQQYLQVTNQEVKDAVPLLERSQWNVQIAIAKFFDGEGPDPVAEAMAAQDNPRPSARHENLQESLMASSDWSSTAARRNRTDPAPRIVPQQPVTHRSPWFLGLLLAPFGWGWRAASALFRTFCYVLSFLPAPIRPRAITAGLRRPVGRRMLMPRDTAARFKREFDEEYGPNELPFFEGGLAQAHDLAKKDLKFLLVLLMSPEHDDTSSFVRDTLLTPDVVKLIKNPANKIVLWGGNVLDSEAYQAATEYNCTKYPFSALVCLTPKEGSTRMGIVKRLVGPMPPATYLSELQGAMEKYGSDLEGVRAERIAQEATRNIRTEQDSAYERSLAIDRQRARERREAAAAVAVAERRAREKAANAVLLGEKRQQWKLSRAAKILPEPPASDKSVVRVALKMPEESGAGRIVRRFPQDAPVEELYAFVECYDVLQNTPEEASGGAQPGDYEHTYTFRIASTLPRVVYEPSTTATMGEKIGKSGNLIVEQLPAESDEEQEDDDEEEEEE
ncbi:UBX domain-containing protein 10 [Tolypocladium ophioglossoides CBS 100239]|uniref:UBX domain-containing protein 10 n=1 Tax=Tolypocladium ophioglossoides (strain CBS 100239) TaxID=1163406 RepID=A0A0L0NEC3_TOLOC|nr:UBX domain-containing protein 10 [Tolypocladium ophioglossoides CBS 100239]